MTPQPERALAQSSVRDPSPPVTEQLQLVVRRWTLARALIVAPGLLAMIGLMSLTGLPPARLAAMSGLCAFLALVVVVRALWTRRAQRSGLTAPAMSPPYAMASILAAGALCALSGGLSSPLLVLVLGPILVVNASRGPGRDARIAMALTALTLLALAFLPGEMWGSPFGRRYHEILVLLGVVMVVALLIVEVRLLNVGLSATSGKLRSVSEDLLQEVAGRRREIEAMGAKVAHEIKNPLTALKSLLQLEKAGATEERSLRRFEVMASEVARMEAIVRDYLTFARPLGVLALAEVDLARVADDVVTVLEGRAGDAGVALLREGAGAHVLGDERRLKEVFLNLGQNALEATPRGGTVIIVVEPAGDGARLIVKDTGSGIEKSVMGKLGTSFVTTREQGTGLGLAIARSIIKQHEGTLEIENRPEGGAAATVLLPRAPAKPKSGVAHG